MNDAKTSILVSQKERIYFNAEEPGTEPSRLWTQPENIPEWGATHSKVRFDLRIVAVGGAPTSWSLGVKFETLLMHTVGVNWQNPLWTPLDATRTASDIVEGSPWSTIQDPADTGPSPLAGGFGVVATNLSTLPLLISRTIANFGLACRVALNPIAVGGTNPYLNLELLATRMNGPA